MVQHLRGKKPVSLYLDATGGGVVSKPPEDKRRIFFALAPLPVTEMISSEHSVPPLTFWLMQFLIKLSRYTSFRVHKVETDYSWALIQAVPLAFNKKSINAYLKRTFSII